MSDNQQFCLRWNNHQSTLVQVIDSLLSSGVLVDCTLAAEGQYLHAHKVVLCACSPYLEVSTKQLFRTAFFSKIQFCAMFAKLCIDFQVLKICLIKIVMKLVLIDML